MTLIGSTTRRVDAISKVLGTAEYPGDINRPNQAYMKVLFAERAHARVLSVDTTEAEAMPGVLAILTAKDVPVNEYGLIKPDQPVLCGPGSSKAYSDIVRYVGDQIALVIAESEVIAARALKAIQVDYEDLPIVTDVRAAMKPDAMRIHPDQESNIVSHLRIRRGDVDAAFKSADIIVESTFHTPVQEHAYLQPEAGVAYIDSEGRITVEVAGQWTHEDQEQIAHALGLPLDRIRVIYPAIGGAFGGREDMSVQILLGLAVFRLSQLGIDRPVKIVWSREESIIGHHKRHPYEIVSRWGANRDGKVVAAEVEIVADSGAYLYTSNKVLGNATLMCTGPYEIDNVKVDSYAVYTNSIPNGAFRGFGGPQAAFAAETQMNKLAEVLGIDPVEIRMRNIVHDGSLLSVGTPLPAGVTIDQVLAECAREAGWSHDESGWRKPNYDTLVPDKPHLRRGLGIACSYKNVGFSFGAPELCVATIEIHGTDVIEHVVLHHAGAEVGQGAHTVFAQMTAEAVGVPLSCVELDLSDTLSSGNSGSVSASRMTFMAGNSIRGAAEAALKKWQDEERPAVATFEYRPPRTTPLDPETGHSNPNFSYGYVAEAVEVEVDIETGETRLVRVICVDDVGKAINRDQVEGQVHGAVVQAAGYALMENFIQVDGKVLTRGLSTYLIPTVLDIPEEVQTIILENPDPIGPWGARGMGEMPYMPLTPAVVDGVHHATGVWIDEFPLIPERVLRHLDTL